MSDARLDTVMGTERYWLWSWLIDPLCVSRAMHPYHGCCRPLGTFMQGQAERGIYGGATPAVRR